MWKWADTQIMLKITWSEMLIKVRGDGVMTRDSVRWKQLSASARMSRIPSSAKGPGTSCRSVILSLMKYIEQFYRLSHACMFSHLLISYTTVPCCSKSGGGNSMCLTDLQRTNKTLKPPPTHRHARTHTHRKQIPICIQTA